MNFVWLFEGKGTEELEMSVALVKKFYPNAHLICISTSNNLPFFDQIYQPLKVLQNKHADQLYKLRETLEFLPEEFWVMNDDFFILDHVSVWGDVQGTLTSLLDKRKFTHDSYYIAIENTIAHLSNKNLSTYSFELHKPIHVVKETLIRSFVDLEDETVMLWRSLYGNQLLHGQLPTRGTLTYYADVKNIPFGSSWCLSTDGYSYPRYRSKLKGVLNG